MRPKHLLVVSALSVAAALVGAQLVRKPQAAPGPNVKPAYGVVDFQSNVGSFKILGAGPTPAQGKLQMSFDGTVLVSGLEGTVTPGPSVRRELNYPDRKKQVFFGNGTLTVDGKWDGIQFFGRDFKGRLNGFGIIRLYGEFDKNLNTGTFVYPGQAPRPWGSGGLTITVPQAQSMQAPSGVRGTLENVPKIDAGGKK